MSFLAFNIVGVYLALPPLSDHQFCTPMIGIIPLLIWQGKYDALINFPNAGDTAPAGVSHYDFLLLTQFNA